MGSNSADVPSKPTKHNDTYPFVASSNFAGKLKHKVVLITGASRGIGYSTALAFAAAGASIACVARNTDALNAVTAAITEKFGTPAIAIAKDITDLTAAPSILKEVTSKLGPVDILINNAALARFNTFEREPDFGKWWSVFTLNLGAALAMTHAVLPSMLSRGSGIIIALGSSASTTNTPWCTAYSTAKASLLKFYSELETEIAGRGVSTFVLHPGDVYTDILKQPDALCMESVAVTPGFAAFVGQWSNLDALTLQTPELAADTMVAMCSIEGVGKLSGKFVDAREDLGEVLKKAA
jgi:short-subunit dehydrogenase